LGTLQLVGGILIYFVAKSAIHEILGAIMFGMGTIALGLSMRLDKAERQLAIFEKLGKPKV